MQNRPIFNVHHILFRAYFGLLAFVIFLILRPGFDLAYYIRPSSTAEQIRARTLEIAARLGQRPDSISAIVGRMERSRNWSLHRKNETLQEWASSGDLLAGWETSVLAKSSKFVTQSSNVRLLFDQRGFMYLVFDDNGRVREFQLGKNVRERFFVEAADSRAAADSIFSILGYPPVFWELEEPERKPALEFWNKDSSSAVLADHPDAVSFSPVLKAVSSTGLPVIIQLEASRTMRVDPSGARLIDGFTPISVKVGTGENIERPSTALSLSDFAFLTVYVILIGFVLWAFFRRVLRGAIEWGRGLAVMLALCGFYVYWRVGYLVDVVLPINLSNNTAPFILSEVLSSLFFGGFAAVAYLAWESMAREDHATQLPVVDAFWQRGFFYKETGRAIIDGYAAGGIYLCIHALALYGLNEASFPFDSQFGHIELLKSPFNLSLTSNALFYGFVTSTFLWGVSVQLFENLKVTGFTRHTITLAFLVISASSAGRILDSSGGYLDNVVLSVLTVPFVYVVYLRTGIVTLMTMFTMAFTVYNVLPFLQASESDLFYQGILTAALGVTPLIWAIIAAIFGNSISTERRYRPKYLDEMEQQVRISNEIRIAADSQYTLLPQKTPEIRGAEVKGFFIPSHEVGGDFFDYVDKPMPDGTPGLALVVADVSGKAMKAAIQAIFTNGLILSRIRTDDPARLLTEINGHIFERTDSKTFVTALVANYHPETHVLTIASAGHCRPILKRNRECHFIQIPDPRFPLGIRKTVAYREISEVLQPDDFVFFYSDGLPEAADESGNYFGYDRLLDFVKELDTNRPVDTICAELREYIRTMKDFKVSDDTTVVCLKIHPVNS